MIEKMLYLYAESPVHAGGSEGSGVVDDPIQREITTEYPVIWGQSLKGALRSLASVHWVKGDVAKMFGTEVTDPGDKESGSVKIGDAQIVAFPVPTVVNSFAWISSTPALSRLSRKLTQTGTSQEIPRIPVSREDAVATTTSQWAKKEIFGLSTGTVTKTGDQSERASSWAGFLADHLLPECPEFKFFREKIREDLVILPDDAFKANVLYGTEVMPRIALDDDKNVIQGHLFFVEYLPTETILAAKLSFENSNDADRFQELFIKAPIFQIGGDETVGKGLVWARMGSTEQ